MSPVPRRMPTAKAGCAPGLPLNGVAEKPHPAPRGRPRALTIGVEAAALSCGVPMPDVLPAAPPAPGEQLKVHSQAGLPPHPAPRVPGERRTRLQARQTALVGARTSWRMLCSGSRSGRPRRSRGPGQGSSRHRRPRMPGSGAGSGA